MVYYSDIIYFPYIYSADALTLVNRVTKKEYEYSDLKLSYKGSYIYIDGSIFKDLPDGQYEYALGGNRGIFQKGSFDSSKIEYNKEITYKQYEG